MGIGEYRVRVKFKRNSALEDGLGGFIDIYADEDLDTASYPYDADLVEVWARVDVKNVSRSFQEEQTKQEIGYDLWIRKPGEFIPGKNDLVEIIGYTVNDATVQGVFWDPKNREYQIKATECL